MEYSCDQCDKSFSTPYALSGHKRVHGKSKGRCFNVRCSCIITKKEINVSNLDRFQSKLIRCKQCPQLIIPSKTFCSSSCSATYNNINRKDTTLGKTKNIICYRCNNYLVEVSVHAPISSAKCEKCKNIIQKEKNFIQKEKRINKSLNPTVQNEKSLIYHSIVGEYSPLFINKCHHCNIKYVSRVRRKYCDIHKEYYSESAKSGYKFTFNVYDFPELFDVNLIEQYGFYQPNERHNKKINKFGVSRDHRVSINEAIRNNYDPYYISHPLNCEIMLHSDNNKKKTKSSITYDELVKLVDDYDENN